jgi:phospholipid/cholesterol/gamma-HCH transport system substrate-binding protein
MTGRGLEIRVGIVVLLAAAILVVGTMWFQKFQYNEKRYSFFVRFDEVGGLVKEDPIQVNGVELGRVQDVMLRRNDVVVEMAVKEGLEIPADSRISLKSIGIMGERFVAIVLGDSAAVISPGDTVNGGYLMGLSEVMGTAGDVLEEIKITSQHIRKMAESLSGGGQLEQGMEDFAVTSKNLRGMTERNRVRLDHAMIRFERSSVLIDSLISGRYTDLDSSLAAIGRVGGKAEVTLDNLNELSLELKEITTKINGGQGSAGRLLNDDTLITRLESTAAQLDSLVADIQRNPGKYVRFSIF